MPTLSSTRATAWTGGLFETRSAGRLLIRIVIATLLIALLAACGAAESKTQRQAPSSSTRASAGGVPTHRPAKPSAPITKPPIVTPGQRVVAQGFLEEVDGQMMLCELWFDKPMEDGQGCTSSVPVELAWAEAPTDIQVFEGLWDGERLHVQAVVDLGKEYVGRRGAWMTAFGYPGRTWQGPEPTCTPTVTNPSLGTWREGSDTAAELPTYESQYPRGKTPVVFVTGDVAGATKAIREVYGGPLCVRVGRGVTHEQADQADKRIGQYAELRFERSGPQTDAGGVLVIASPVALTPEIHRQVLDLAGPEASPSLRFFPGLYPLPGDQPTNEAPQE